MNCIIYLVSMESHDLLSLLKEPKASTEKDELQPIPFDLRVYFDTQYYYSVMDKRKDDIQRDAIYLMKSDNSEIIHQFPLEHLNFSNSDINFIRICNWDKNSARGGISKYRQSLKSEGRLATKLTESIDRLKIYAIKDVGTITWVNILSEKIKKNGRNVDQLNSFLEFLKPSNGSAVSEYEFNNLALFATSQLKSFKELINNSFSDEFHKLPSHNTANKNLITTDNIIIDPDTYLELCIGLIKQDVLEPQTSVAESAMDPESEDPDSTKMYTGTIFNRENIPMLQFLCSVPDESEYPYLNGKTGIILHYWYRSVIGDAVTAFKKKNVPFKRAPLGPLILPLIIQCMAHILNRPISYIFLSTMPHTRKVFKKLQYDQNVIFMENPSNLFLYKETQPSDDSTDYGCLENEIIVVTPELMSHWKKFTHPKEASEPAQKKSRQFCETCGLVQGQLYAPLGNAAHGVYCGDSCYVGRNEHHHL